MIAMNIFQTVQTLTFPGKGEEFWWLPSKYIGVVYSVNNTAPCQHTTIPSNIFEKI